VAIPEIERQIGIETYVTKTPGIGGAIRREVGDFVVEEVLVDGSKASVEADASAAGTPALGASAQRQRFLLCVLVKRNWDTFIALKNVAKELGVEQGRIQIAGIKDAKAITAQHVTIEGVSAEEAAKIQFKDIQLRPIGYFREQLCSFYLLGNNFKITVKAIPCPKPTAEERTQNVALEITTAGGIPNFYGHQRFGTARAITHLVGKAMVLGDLEEAAMVFLAKPSIHEHPQSMQARSALWDTRDFEGAIRDFPSQLRFERTMLRHLVEHIGDFSGAFRCLPLKLRMLFVQAWQSYLFNRFLSARIRAGFSLGKADVGDYVVNVERSGLPLVKTGKIVETSNAAEVNRLIDGGKMRVALPIFGARQKLSQGAMGELEQAVLQEEGVEAGGFRVPDMPEVCAKGELRAAVCPVADFAAGKASADSDAGLLQVALEFRLLRGSYATVLLREILKPTDLIAAGF
jgi:tRNA pseudouridine13 synthase